MFESGLTPEPNIPLNKIPASTSAGCVAGGIRCVGKNLPRPQSALLAATEPSIQMFVANGLGVLVLLSFNLSMLPDASLPGHRPPGTFETRSSVLRLQSS